MLVSFKLILYFPLELRSTSFIIQCSMLILSLNSVTASFSVMLKYSNAGYKIYVNTTLDLSSTRVNEMYFTESFLCVILLVMDCEPGSVLFLSCFYIIQMEILTD